HPKSCGFVARKAEGRTLNSKVKSVPALPSGFAIWFMVDLSSPLGSNMTLMSGSQLFIRCSALLFVVPAVYAGPGDLSMSSQVQYPTVIQGYQDPVTAQIYNEAVPG